jgi:hypothetical protein
MDSQTLKNSNDSVNSLSEILNTINQQAQEETNLPEQNNDTKNNDTNNNESNTTESQTLTQSNQTETLTQSNQTETLLKESANLDLKTTKENIELFVDSVDRRIGKYLLDELEKKQLYIEELEELIKFQEKEIGELKSKLDTVGKLGLLAKLKSNMEGKLNQLEQEESNGSEQELHKSEQLEQTERKPKVVQVIQVKKQNQIEIENPPEQPIYPSVNPDLVLNSSSLRQKAKPIKKEEEEPRYNGIVILEKPKREPEIKIVMDYETETSENTDRNSEILKQRRRARKL